MSRQDIADAQDAQDAQAAEVAAELRSARRRLRELSARVLAPDRLAEALASVADAPETLPTVGPWRDGPRRK